MDSSRTPAVTSRYRGSRGNSLLVFSQRSRKAALGTEDLDLAQSLQTSPPSALPSTFSCALWFVRVLMRFFRDGNVGGVGQVAHRE